MESIRIGRGPSVDLVALWELGAKYHGAREQLDGARAEALDALAAMGKSADDRSWRGHARVVLCAADTFDDAAATARRLVGLSLVADAAAAASIALTDLVRSRAGGTREDGSMPHLDAEMAWEAALRRIALPPNRYSIRDEIASKPGEAGRDRAYVHDLDADNPRAPGAFGTERIVGLAKPWSAVAWRAWCAAGRGIAWSAAWDAWAPLERFTNVEIGRARGLVPSGRSNKSISDAVNKSRQRTPL